MLENIAAAPLHFAQNDGQAPDDVRFVAQGVGYTVALRDTDAVLMLPSRPASGSEPATDTIRLGLRGASSPRATVGVDPLPGRVNIIRGQDPANWHEGIATFARVRYDEVYPGIDLVYYGNQRQLQYDFEIAPGADPGRVALDVEGADRIGLDAAGNLELHVGDEVLRQHKPFTYQIVDGARREIPSRFAIEGSTVRFDVGEYDRRQPLVIDPVIAYSSWFGASGEEGVMDMAVDTDGGIVVYGYSHDVQGTLQFPTTAGAVKSSRGADDDAFVTKFNASGSAIVFSTLLGGSGTENFYAYAYVGGLALDASSNVYVTGMTRSADFPVTGNGFDTDYNDDDPGATGTEDGFYVKLSPSGGLLYGTYLGGRRIDYTYGLDIDGAGNVYIVGTTDSDETAGANGGFVLAGSPFDATYNGSRDLFLLRFNAAGALTYSTYVGGSSGEGIYGADVKVSRTTANVVYVASDTGNSSFPTTNSRYQTFGTGPEGVVFRMNLGLAPASQMTYGTFFGGNGTDFFTSLAVDASDNVYAAGGLSSSQGSLPAAITPVGSPAASGTDVLVAKFNTAASGASSLVYAIRLNGTYTDDAADIALDAQNQAWVAVNSGSFSPAGSATDFPLRNTLSTLRSGNGVHQAVVQLNAAGNDFLLSSLIGGSSGVRGPMGLAITASGEVWVGGTSGGGTTALGLVNPYQSAYGGGDDDATLQRIGKQADLSITKSVDKPYPQYTVLPGDTLTYTITVTNTTGDVVSNALVTDNLPPQVVYVSCTSTASGICGGSGANRTVVIPTLGVGQSAVVTLVTQVASNVGPNTVWTNTATIAANGVVDPNSTNNTGGNGGANGNGSGGVPAITNPAADADGDGLPNGWEQQYGLNPLSNSVADGASGDPDGDGLTNAQELANGSHPRGFVITYLAEGATGQTFDTRLAIANPTANPALVLTRFQRSDQVVVPVYQVVPPMGRITIDAEGLNGLSAAEFSTLIEADVQVVADRTMTWDQNAFGAHAERGILTRTATTWYLAEGATHSAFDLFYLLQNPNANAAQVQITYLLPAPAPPVVKNYTVAAGSRQTIWVDLITELASTDVSAIVQSTNGVPIIVERAMYATSEGRMFNAGHESAGVTSPANNWFLAEGATGTLFDLFVLIANPNAQPAAVQARYLLTNGSTITKTYTVAGNSRRTIWVDLEDPALANASLSTAVTSTNNVPIIVERSMWWPGPTPADWYEAHNSPGETVTGTKWAFAEGELGGAFDKDTFILIANTSNTAGQASVTLLLEGGGTLTKTVNLPANSRTTVSARVDFPSASGGRFGGIVESVGSPAAQIVVERAMYWWALGEFWAAGTDALATRLQ